MDLTEYANKRIVELGLGAGGKLGTEFVVAYNDAGPGFTRLSDGHVSDECDSVESIEESLLEWREWADE